jgi:hypothetical protein
MKELESGIGDLKIEELEFKWEVLCTDSTALVEGKQLSGAQTFHSIYIHMACIHTHARAHTHTHTHTGVCA